MAAAVIETNCCLLNATATPSITNNEKNLLPAVLILVLLIGGILLCVFGCFIYRYVKKSKLERQKPVESSVSPPTLPLAMPGQINSSSVLPEQITSLPRLDHDSGHEENMYASIYSNLSQSTGDFPVGQDDPTVLQGPEKQFDKTYGISTNARFDIEQAHGSATVIPDEPKHSEASIYSNLSQSTEDFPVGQDDPTVLQGPEKQLDKTYGISTNARFDIEQAHGSATVIPDEPKHSESMEYRFPPKRLPRGVIIYLANEMKSSPQLNEVVASFYKI